ncbi:PaaI family thioesterase [Paraburkholderia sp. J12]|uniref:PaaI family thioesterase n=1 Tax=Paraburkholderia sp. J12 TaxID=2805432 RepID=UPI002ABE04C4|nr:PaaI family thioesterase [Paraburkholderia sp. J12]
MKKPDLLCDALPTSGHEAENGVPEGYAPIERGGPYFRALGPLYARPAADGGLIVAVRVREAHANSLGIAHGGMLMTLADGAMGINLNLLRATASGTQATVTTTLTSEFLAAARVGDWLEAHASVRRNGRRIVFAQCSLRVGEREVLHASGTFLPLAD